MSRRMQIPGLVILLFIVCFFPLHAQRPSVGVAIDPVSMIGTTLDELLGLFGTPDSVYAVRGLEEWQDDVVFVYPHGDYYVYGNRVWQLSIASAGGINIGDTRAVVALVLDTKVEFHFDSAFYFLDDGDWPLMIRYDFDRDGKVRVIFIYRTDF